MAGKPGNKASAENGRKGGRNNKANPLPENFLISRLDEVMPKILDGLIQMALHDTASSIRLAASKELMDRRFGKAVQAVTGSGGGPVELKITWQD